MADLTFSNGNTLNQSLRANPTKFNRSRLRYNFEQSEGQRAAEVYYPSKFLPVQFQDTNTEDFVVIPKGKVVAALGVGEYLAGGSTDPSGNLAWPNASGSIPVFQNRSSATVNTRVDGTFWGYNETVNGLLVPCNGGTDRRFPANLYEYTANDVTAGTYAQDGGLAANGDDVTGALASGNMPIGAAMYDIYQDIRGKNINYTHWDKSSLVQDWFVTVPFVRLGEGTTFDLGSSTDGQGIADDNATMNAQRDKTYLIIPSGSIPRTGATIKADVRGNYIMQDPFNTIADINGTTAAANPTVQTVGRLMTLDTRFPKDFLHYVDTYEGSQMAGTDTGGLPYWLFIFAYDWINAQLSAAPTVRTVVDHVQDGRFGMARFNLHIN